MVFSLVVVGMIWGWFMQPQFGLLDTLMHYLGILSDDQQFDFLTRLSWESTVCLIVAACWPHASYCMILYLAGLSNLQKNIIEADKWLIVSEKLGQEAGKKNRIFIERQMSRDQIDKAHQLAKSWLEKNRK